mmetsp:Transcript_28713/g.52460  ORF Transcript_28713/g.52460 Transcript_28713/m.52460 type:complete len:201 (+) Transcript_28713:290-892(+)
MFARAGPSNTNRPLRQILQDSEHPVLVILRIARFQRHDAVKISVSRMTETRSDHAHLVHVLRRRRNNIRKMRERDAHIRQDGGLRSGAYVGVAILLATARTQCNRRIVQTVPRRPQRLTRRFVRRRGKVGPAEIFCANTPRGGQVLSRGRLGMTGEFHEQRGFLVHRLEVQFAIVLEALLATATTATQCSIECADAHFVQ